MVKLALITGATSGIGFEYSRLLASKGWNLIITGRRETLLKERALYLEKEFGISVDVAIVDFTDSASFNTFFQDYVVKKGDSIGFLINNVGFSNRNDFFNSEFKDSHRMIEAHISRLTEITHQVVKGMKERKNGYIVNVSSLVGFLPSLHDPFYSGSKSFITTYSESIALILKEYNIIVQSLCPGFTRTDFHKDMNLKENVFKNRGLKRWMSPQDVASYSYKKLGKGRVIVIPGWANRVVYHVVRLLPKSLYYNLAGRKKMLDEVKQVS